MTDTPTDDSDDSIIPGRECERCGWREYDTTSDVCPECGASDLRGLRKVVTTAATADADLDAETRSDAARAESLVRVMLTARDPTRWLR